VSGLIETGDGCHISWRADGDANAVAVILSNSLGTDMTMWDALVPVLAEQFRVVRYDSRGHGGSDAPPGGYSIDRLGRDVLELADALGITQFSFCGLSLGGMIGQWLGWRSPERLRSLVIANSSPYMGPPSGWDARIRTVRQGGTIAIAQATLERWFSASFRVDPANTAAVLARFVETPVRGYAGCCAAIRDMDMRALLPLIQTPTLVIGGTQDPATPPYHTALLTSRINGAECVMLDAAHLSNVERPAEFNEAVIDFLTRT